MERKRKVYIAGPMRGLPGLNFAAFDAAKALLIERGWDPISPADIDRESGITEQVSKAASKDVQKDAEMRRHFVERDVAALLSLRAEEGDAIALLKGWTDSTGANAELRVARWLGLAILAEALDFGPVPPMLLPAYLPKSDVEEKLSDWVYPVQAPAG